MSAPMESRPGFSIILSVLPPPLPVMNDDSSTRLWLDFPFLSRGQRVSSTRSCTGPVYPPRPTFFRVLSLLSSLLPPRTQPDTLTNPSTLSNPGPPPHSTLSPARPL